jgi:O-glycosyl hydrolase
MNNNIYNMWILCTNSDENECLVNQGGCSQECNNTEGSFNCYCRNGYNMQANGVNCTGINWFIRFVCRSKVCIHMKKNS